MGTSLSRSEPVAAPAPPRSGRILVVDDEWTIRDILETILGAEGYTVETADGGAAALAAIERADFDLVITDLNMPVVGGLDVLRRMKELGRGGLGVVATGFGSVQAAVDALKAGAFDYITKPFHMDEIKFLVRKAMEFRALRAENEMLRRRLAAPSGDPLDALVGPSEAMAGVRRTLETVARSESSVLVMGESGTGKELVARTLHRMSHRAAAPFAMVACSAIPPEMLERELFGEAGRPDVGRVREARGGTLFLDEIGELPLRLQVKILRVVESGEVSPVGGGESFAADVRVLAATRAPLDDFVARGLFRKDLYYRLNVIPLPLPPLRERREDVAALAARFAERFARGAEPVRFDDEAMAALTAYRWRGNVRELEHLVERLSILRAGRTIGLADLPEEIREEAEIEAEDAESAEFAALVDQFERRLIERAMVRAGGVKNRAAQLLRLKRTTLVEKMRKKGMLDAWTADS